MDFVRSINVMRDRILVANRDVGFVGKSVDVIAHACRLLGPGLISLQLDGAEVTW